MAGGPAKISESHRGGEMMKASWGKARIGAIAILGAAGLAILAIVVLNNPRLVQAQLAGQFSPPPRAVPFLVQPGSQPVPHPPASPQAVHALGAPGAVSGIWTPLNTQPSFEPAAVFLLTDGRVLVQDFVFDSANAGWWTLTPDKTGSYIIGHQQQPCDGERLCGRNRHERSGDLR